MAIKTKNSGICGPFAIADILGKTVGSVIADWVFGYKGYAPFWQIKAMLEKYGIRYTLCKGKKSKVFDMHGYDFGIARIQWEGNWKHWAEAQQHTHYVALKRIKGKILVSCDGFGIFEANTTDYLKDGYITSYIFTTGRAIPPMTKVQGICIQET